MKIGIFQPDIGKIGGSIATIVTFADTFKELGHEVKVYCNFVSPKNILKSVDQVIEYNNCSNLMASDFIQNAIVNKMKSSDLDFIFYTGRYSPRLKNINKNVVLWTIHKGDMRIAGRLLERWTNSQTTMNILKPKTNLFIVIPPHDYSIFREAASENRIYDVVSVLRANDYKDKGIPLYAKNIKNLKLEGMLISTSYEASTMKKLNNSGIKFVCNKTRKEVAEILGQAKVMFMPSYKESCPLVIYEALNAGAIPVSRNVGAVNEQLGGHGLIFNNNNQSIDLIKKALNSNFDRNKLIERGLVFDKINVKETINKRLNIIANKIRG